MAKLSIPSAKKINANREAMSDSYRELVAAKDQFRKTAEAAGVEAKEEVIEQWLKGKRKATKAGSQAQQYFEDRPGATLIVVFGLGFLVSRLFSRR